MSKKVKFDRGIHLMLAETVIWMVEKIFWNAVASSTQSELNSRQVLHAFRSTFIVSG